MPIKAGLIEDYLIPVTDKNQYECNCFILIMKFWDIEQLEQGAIEFIKKAQIFNVYLIYEDNRKETIVVPCNIIKLRPNTVQIALAPPIS